MTVTGIDFVFRPQPTIYLLWAMGDDETRRGIEAAHERAIERALEWIEDEVAVIGYGKRTRGATAGYGPVWPSRSAWSGCSPRSRTTPSACCAPPSGKQCTNAKAPPATWPSSTPPADVGAAGARPPLC
ncbi:hypothetical protein GCM10017688_41090 [Streptomyces ramulosus]